MADEPSPIAEVRLWGRTVTGWPNADGVSKVWIESHPAKVIGTVREQGRRFFPIDVHGFPIEGTFRTKRDAAAAVRGAWAS